MVFWISLSPSFRLSDPAAADPGADHLDLRVLCSDSKLEHRALAAVCDDRNATRMGHGASWKGGKVGTFGDIAAFSTMYRKAHVTGASGGLVFTRDRELYRRALQDEEERVIELRTAAGLGVGGMRRGG